jgi:RiboL-PSP-HEPN
VSRLRQRLDEVFTRADILDPGELELRSDFARYLCVLISGYVEKSLQELTIQWCRSQSSPSVLRYATGSLRRLQNLNSERLKQVLSSFDEGWRQQVEARCEEGLDALDSLYGNRNLIAHGANVGLTLTQVRRYLSSVQEIIDLLIELLDPVPVL